MKVEGSEERPISKNRLGSGMLLAGATVFLASGLLTGSLAAYGLARFPQFRLLYEGWLALAIAVLKIAFAIWLLKKSRQLRPS